jgi:coenzyme F420-reducing hydrogenase gamma subunit
VGPHLTILVARLDSWIYVQLFFIGCPPTGSKEVRNYVQFFWLN